MWAAGGRDGVGAHPEGSPEVHGQLTALPGLTWHPWDCVCHLCPLMLSLGSRVPYGLRCPSGTHRSHVGSCAPYGFTSSSICSCVHHPTACPRRAHVSPHGLTWPLWAHMSPIGSHPPWAHMSPRGLPCPPGFPCHPTGSLKTLWDHVSSLGPCLPPMFSPGLHGFTCPPWALVSPIDPHVT